MLASPTPWLLFVFGTLIGSFLNVVIYRTPAVLLAGWDEESEDEEPFEIPEAFGERVVFTLKFLFSDVLYSITYLFKDFWIEAFQVLKGLSFPGSRCGNCHHDIAWYDNLPVLSWFILGGRCRHCKASYSFRYPAIEFLTGLLFVYVYSLYPTTQELIFWLPLVSLLWAIFWIDFDTHFVFNVMTYPSILLGILYNGSEANLYESFIGALVAWCFFEGVALLSVLLLKKQGMGGGDVKLAVLMGIWLGPEKLLVALVMAFVTGSIAGVALMLKQGESKPFPFGPFLVVGMLLSMAVGDDLWAWYISKSAL